MQIQEITLFTSNIQNQRHFYKHVLQFEMTLDSSDKIAFKAGKSTLVFQYKSEIKPSHVAFNIPSNAINDALIWLKQRTNVLPFQNEAIAEFTSWNAKAIYFYDADHNIMEFIARESIGIESDMAFSTNTIVSISEMAIATTNIESIYNQINTLKPIPVFDGDFDLFCAVGNDEGLFILINKEKKSWFPTMEEAFTSDFIIRGDYNFSFENGKLKEIM